MIDVAAVSAVHLPSLRALFDASSSSCFCRYWHFTGTKNEWLDRCANRPEENARELEDAIERGVAAGRGLVAVDRREGDEASASAVLGWLKLTARDQVPKLRALPVYRNLDLGDERTTYSVGCVLVHPEHRHRGVARALITAAPRFAQAWGARAVEGYPRRSSEPLHPEEAWQGPERLFRDAGFTPMRSEAASGQPEPYPVYRRSL